MFSTNEKLRINVTCLEAKKANPLKCGFNSDQQRSPFNYYFSCSLLKVALSPEPDLGVLVALL